ncbi:TonB family protein, partial [bacterium]|nr:TonB family protein [bacterium]
RPAPRRAPKPEVPVDRGTAGRQRAQEEVAKLESVTASLDGMLADVSASLTATNEPEKQRTTRRRRTRGGRSASEVASVAPVAGTSGPGAKALSGALVQLGDPAASGLPGASATRGDGSTVAAGEVRSDAELMAVVRKYAPGLQFCYDNELRSSPGLGGKLVVSLTVAASGRVSDAVIVGDTVGSAAMAECALTQIRAWKFPEIPEGSVTFQVPFVYTPPE